MRPPRIPALVALAALAALALACSSSQPRKTHERVRSTVSSEESASRAALAPSAEARTAFAAAPAHVGEEPAVAAEPAAADGESLPAAELEAPVYGLSGGWGGVRDYLGEHGFTIDFNVTFEANRVLSGGLHQQLTAHALYDLSGSFDLDRIAGWKDAQLAFEAYVIGGHNPSQDVGDYQSFSDFSADELGYTYACCNGVTLRPDLQYITSPGGDASIDDALVFSLRLELGF